MGHGVSTASDLNAMPEAPADAAPVREGLVFNNEQLTSAESDQLVEPGADGAMRGRNLLDRRLDYALSTAIRHRASRLAPRGRSLPGRLRAAPRPAGNEHLLKTPLKSSGNERIRLLLLLTSTAGGAGLQNYFLARGLSRQVFDLQVAYGPGYPLDVKYQDLGIPVHLLSLSRNLAPAINIRGFFQIWRLLRRERFDVVCTSCSIAGMLGRFAAAIARVPTRVHVLHVYACRPYQNPLKRAFYWGIERALDPLTTRYVAVSGATKQYGVDRHIMSPEKVSVIFNAIESQSASVRPAADVRRELGLRPDSQVVGTIGRYEQQKGLEFLLRAAALVVRDHPETEFLVVGDGPLRGELSQLARSLGIADSVHFTGWREDVPDMLGVMKIFCLASLWETFGLVLAEAMQAALPVVATRVDAIPEVVSEGETGLLVPPRDPERLAAKIIELLDNPQLASELGAAGRRRALSMCSLDGMVRQYEELFLELAGSEAIAPVEERA